MNFAGGKASSLPLVDHFHSHPAASRDIANRSFLPYPRDMAKGYQANQERQAIILSFGKELARRSRSRCELCEKSGASLSVFEIPPESKGDPVIDRCVFLCDDCAEQAGNLKRFRAGEHWRCLAQTVWSETPAVQALAARLLRRQAHSQPWAEEALDGLFLDEAVEEWSLAAE